MLSPEGSQPRPEHIADSDATADIFGGDIDMKRIKFPAQEMREQYESARNKAEVDQIAGDLTMLITGDHETTTTYADRVAGMQQQGHEGTPDEVLTDDERAVFIKARDIVTRILEITQRQAREEARPKVYGGDNL